MSESPTQAGPESALAQAIELHKAGRLAEAEAAYRALLERDAGHGLAWFGLGSLEAQRGHFHSAILALEKAMARAGPRAEMQHNIAGAKAGLGRFAEAEAHFREALRLRPDYPEAYYNFAQLDISGGKAELVERIEAMLAGAQRSDTDRCFLHFAAGKLLDELGEHERAFAHYAAGNAVKQRHGRGGEWREQLEAIRAVFDHDTVAALARHGNPTRRFVFIVGMPRSGTSLVEQILAAHPAVHAAGELPDIAAISRTLGAHVEGGGAYPELVRRLAPQVVRGFGEAYARQVGGRAPQARYITDKMPLNFRHLGLITALLPEARIIHCRRNAADTCLSCYFQNFRENHEYSFDLETLGDFYAGYHGLMAHWDAVLPRPPLVVDYEAVVSDLPREARRLIELLGLPWDERCLRFNEVQRPVTTASRWQVRQPIYTRSRARWRRYEPQLEPLLARLRAAGIAY